MPIQVTFQLDNSRERADMAKYINAIETSINPYGNKQSQPSYGKRVVDNQDSVRIIELEKEKKELQELIKRHQQDNIKNVAKINSLQDELDALRDENEKKIKEAEENKKLFEEACQESEKMKAEYKRQLLLKDDERAREVDLRKGEEQKLRDKIDELQKQLEIYNPSLNMKTSSETSFYKVVGNLLVETNIKDAPYIAQCMGDNKYRFQFNFEKGPVQEACSKKEEWLLPFCDIMQETENPNNIRPADWGVAIMVGGDLKVETKAKINLSRD